MVVDNGYLIIALRSILLKSFYTVTANDEIRKSKISGYYTISKISY